MHEPLALAFPTSLLINFGVELWALGGSLKFAMKYSLQYELIGICNFIHNLNEGLEMPMR
jgi:hypothetical protein